MAERWDNVVPIRGEKGEDASPLKSGGGDGTSGGMEARVKSLEDKFEKIDGKLDILLIDITSMKATMATRDDVSKLSERAGKVETAISMLPGSLQLMGFVLAVLAIAGLAKYFAP